MAEMFFADASKLFRLEVVRCGECVHYKEVCGEYGCFHPKMESGWESEGGEHLLMKPTDFCSYGERRQDDQ